MLGKARSGQARLGRVNESTIIFLIALFREMTYIIIIMLD